MKEDFDPDRFISVFEARDSSQLAWLDELKGDPAGRCLIYQLSASHRSCLVLNFAIQKLLRAGAPLPRIYAAFTECGCLLPPGGRHVLNVARASSAQARFVTARSTHLIRPGIVGLTRAESMASISYATMQIPGKTRHTPGRAECIGTSAASCYGAISNRWCHSV